MEGSTPLDITIARNKAEATFSQSYLETPAVNGIPLSKILAVPTPYAHILRSPSFEYVGCSAITPASPDSSSYGLRI